MLALVLREPQADTVSGLIDRWGREGTEMHAPLLAQYEVATALTRRRARGEFSREETDEALGFIDGLDVTFDLAPDNARAIEIAREMERSSAYDAAYLALAERLDTEVWTLDGPLARNVGNHGRVRLID
jgi:predicted nucleic acid-binding protein